MVNAFPHFIGDSLPLALPRVRASLPLPLQVQWSPLAPVWLSVPLAARRLARPACRVLPCCPARCAARLRTARWCPRLACLLALVWLPVRSPLPCVPREGNRFIAPVALPTLAPWVFLGGGHYQHPDKMVAGSIKETASR